MTTRVIADILVVGGGPAGTSAAAWAASRGHDVVLLERDAHGRPRVCGDALTPTAVGELYELGLGPALQGAHRHRGVRMSAHGRSVELPWPDDAGRPDHGLGIRRSDLDALLADHAAASGATVWHGVEVDAPIVEHGHVRGCLATASAASTGPEGPVEVRAQFVVIADGPLSNFGRALGTARSRTFAQGIAMRGYFRSPRHDDDWIESVFDLHDSSGEQLPGYGWVFPLGDGTLNVGVGLLGHHAGNEALSAQHLFDQWVAQIPERWEVAPDALVEDPAGGRLPMGASVRPRSGPNWVVVGDAAGSVNPFNGDGLEPALANGRLAADVLSEAIEQGDGLVLRRYEAELDARYDNFYKLGRLATRALGRPGLMRRITRLGVRSRRVTDFVVRLSSGLERADHRGASHRISSAATRVAGWIPDD